MTRKHVVYHLGYLFLYIVMARVSAPALINFVGVIPPALIQNRLLFEVRHSWVDFRDVKSMVRYVYTISVTFR